VLAELAAVAVLSGSATAYSPCDGSTRMTASGRTAHAGVVANNTLPLGTWVVMVSPRRVMGKRTFRVLDRGGPGFALDFFTEDCAWMHSWGRRQVRFRVVTKRELFRGKPVWGWRVVSSPRGGRLVWRWP
jgi:3D (Asp-Asp-Asp) domain-containing protein